MMQQCSLCDKAAAPVAKTGAQFFLSDAATLAAYPAGLQQLRAGVLRRLRHGVDCRP